MMEGNEDEERRKESSEMVEVEMTGISTTELLQTAPTKSRQKGIEEEQQDVLANIQTIQKIGLRTAMQ